MMTTWRHNGGGLRTALLAATIMAALATACSSIDCPLNNLVYTNYVIYNSDGERDTLALYLTVTTTSLEDREVTVLNLDTETDSFSLPISYEQDADVFTFALTDSLGSSYTDVVNVAKENTMHFEDIDCTPSFFHTITGVTYTKNAIDSIIITDPEVNYDTSKKHFRIYFDDCAF